LAEFGVAIEVFNRMVISMRNSVGRADIGAGEAGDTVLGVLDQAEALFGIQFKDFSRANVDAEFASPA
jgi:hypothetical protein